MQNALLLYLRLFVSLIILVFASYSAPDIFSLFHQSAEPELVMSFFSMALIFALSFGIFYLSKGTKIPSFVVAIFFGMAAKPLLVPVIEQHTLLSVLVGFGATLILFGGGLETPFQNFKKLLGKITALSFPGLLITAFLFSLSIFFLSPKLGQGLSVTAAILLGAILASTDPAAIIPILKKLRFNNPETKDLIISESAVTDVTGTLLTVVFLSTLASTGLIGSSISSGYQVIFSAASGVFLLKQLAFGTLFGFLGYLLLNALTQFKSSHNKEHEVDSAFFLFIPIMIFTLALALGGSGYLAAFIAGLLFVTSEHLEETERFFNHIIDGFFKPTIFLLLGALVDIPALIEYAPIGIASAALFMFVIRPLSTFVVLSPFLLKQKDKMTWREIAFISCVRETGAIPAVLLVTIASLNISGIEGLLPIGMWIILATLIVEPPITPWIASKLRVAEIIHDTEPESDNDKSYVALGTRGNSYENRLPIVAQFASDHGIPKVTLMLCLEYKYQPKLEQEIHENAFRLFEKINQDLLKAGRSAIEFRFYSSAGFLQENIDYIAKNDPHAVVIFVGRKMLDYRLKEVKKLAVPLRFME